MKLAGLILGILGGLAGLVGGSMALFAGGIGSAFNAPGAETVAGLGFAAIPLAILGIVGGALAIGKPKLAAILMIISAIGGVIAISAFYSVAAILLGVGALLAFLGAREGSKADISL
ncbi:MAG: hypothetical protein H5U02_11685 [Clostridia bacterium]|nr:hypothetical protein [Clostridia bacterium]